MSFRALRRDLPRSRRDINVDTHYPFRVEDLRFLPGAISTLVVLAALPVHLIVVSNQAGIALGMYRREAMSAFNKQLRESIEKAEDALTRSTIVLIASSKTLLLASNDACVQNPPQECCLRQQQSFILDLAHSLCICDKPSDVAAGLAAGCYTILLAQSETNVVPRGNY